MILEILKEVLFLENFSLMTNCKSLSWYVDQSSHNFDHFSCKPFIG